MGREPKAAQRTQRDRLQAATVAVVAERGYGATRVSDIVAAAGISRNSFYRNFADMEDCVATTIGNAVDATAVRVVAAYRSRAGDCAVRLGAAFDTLVETIVDHPDAARLCCVEVHAAGPVAIERAGRLERLLERVVADAAGRSGAPPPPPAVVRTVIGGLRQLVHARVRVRREHELVRLAPELLDWALSYAGPYEGGSVALLDAAQAKTAPEPLEAAATGAGQVPTASDTRERMLIAVAELAATKGHQATTIIDIADVARVSLTTFYKHFDSKEEALLAAAAYGEQLLLAETLPAYQAAPSWPLAVRAGLRAFLRFLAANPALARLGLIDVYSSGIAALEWREKSVAGFQALMLPGYDHHPSTPPIAAEAVGAAIAATLYDRMLTLGPERLLELAPLATFIALAPFVGTPRALALATEPEPGGPRTPC